MCHIAADLYNKRDLADNQYKQCIKGTINWVGLRTESSFIQFSLRFSYPHEILNKGKY